MTVLGGALGCAGLPPLQLGHEDAKEAAHERWDRIRYGVKFQLAEQHYRAGRIDECIKEARKAAALDPDGTAARVLLAQALLEKGQMVAARQVIEEAAGITPERPRVLYMQGVLAEQTEEYDRAVQYYRRAGELDPSIPIYLTSEAECLVAAGRPRVALDLLNSRREEFRSDPTVEVLRAETALLLGDTETALASFRAAMRTAGDSLTLAQDFGLLLERSGRCAEAIAVLEPLYERSRHRMSATAIRGLGSAYFGLRRPQRAKQVLDDLVRDNPDDQHAWLVLARAALACADLATARRCVDRLAILAPDDPDTHFLTGYVCWKQKDTVLAERALKAALAVQPRDATAHCLLGAVYQERNDAATAREHFETALQCDPDCGWARTALGELNRL